MKLDRVKMTNLKGVRVANTSMAIIDTIQEREVEEQMVALATTFMMLSKHLGVTPQDLFEISNNLVHTATDYRPEFKGIQMYMENEYDGQ